jgi:RNA polymerase sigma-70 factor, ECF subfamily
MMGDGSSAAYRPDAAPIDSSETADAAELTAVVERIRSGQPGALDDLVKRYGTVVRILVQRARFDQTRKDDLYQEIFRRAIEKIQGGEVRQPERLSGYMCGLTRNLIIDEARRSAKQSRNEDLDKASRVIHPSTGQLEQLLREEKAKLVRRVLHELARPLDREVLYRFYIAEESKADICAGMELRSLQFDQILFRAKRRYRELYEEASSGTMK